MAEKKVVLTYEGLKNMEAELENLKTVRRQDVAEKIKEARGQGDLSENAEYDAAKEEPAEIEARIVEIENMLKNAEVIDESEVATDVVSIGSKVTVKDTQDGETSEYLIVGSTEADPLKGKISDESPVGSALLGHKKGAKVLVEAPMGVIEYKIVKISK